MIYRILRFILRIAIHIFYKKVAISRPSVSISDGPLIIMSNHPNTLMDPLLLAIIFKQKVGFLANASIFVHAVINRVFDYFHVIPVYRQQDVKAGQEIDNQDSFRACYDYLEQNNTLVIFPEGTSVHELKLRKIKTGGVRIGFGAEARRAFGLGVKILPVGIYYNHPTQFRSKVHINIGEPISLQNYRSEYQQNEIATVQQLTNELRIKMETLTIHTENAEQEALFYKIKKLYKPQLKEELDAKNDHEDFVINQEIAHAIRFFHLHVPIQYQELKQKVEALDELSTQIKSKSNFDKSYVGLWSMTVLKSLYLILASPLFVMGLAGNYLPFQLPSWLARKISQEREYHASITMVIGMITFPLYYTLLTWILRHYLTLHWEQATLCFIAFPLFGIYALHYYKFAKRMRHYMSVLFISSKKEQLRNLKLLKTSVTHQLDNAKQMYLDRLNHHD
ncbi:1-acyl-sn-glycerol-3-phosphate acyltransferase [Reichenbachiella agariperforans]|uniref:1-acyl-sn-glycerol-3-phosphate acyltransferase n=1 Tax=Reichenbachiella agariperforans TaxID=156994 RepID=UPI001C09E2F4|nr:1-acyl-sn-glycerol-3-phosphate acyltransferase [Reichenbachiella agariperforans]MBU2912502.1 1-acyl-sn-glycerol-3-phosphate acyltransferase [Reichenbachiella agariperforans]